MNKTFKTIVALMLVHACVMAQPNTPTKLPSKEEYKASQERSMTVATPATPAAPQTGQTIGTVVTLTGFMLNGNTLAPVEANYAVYENGKKIGQSRKSNAADGFLVTGLKPGGSYTMRIEDPRYFRQEFAISLPQTSKYAEISKDFIVRTMETGRKIMVVPPPFDLRKNVVKSGVEDDIKNLAQMLAMNPSVNVELVCYPDEEVASGAATATSSARGAALKAAMEQNGVNGSRVSVRTVTTVDPINPPPLKKGAKGKRYVGSVYLVITKV